MPPSLAARGVLGHHCRQAEKMTTLAPRGPQRRSGVERRVIDAVPTGRERRRGTDRRLATTSNLTSELDFDSVRETWRHELFTNLEWQAEGEGVGELKGTPIKHGEAAGFVARADGFPLPGYVKPTRLAAGQPDRAANEKICADLAHELDITTPPVLLLPTGDVPNGEDSHRCVSLIMYDWLEPWGSLESMDRDGPAWAIVKMTLAACSGVVAFDTLVDNTDRDNAGNCVIALQNDRPAQGGVFFLDYSFTLDAGNRWSDDKFENVAPVNIPGFFRDALDIQVLGDAVERIEALPEDAVVGIVSRIPDEFMDEITRQLVVRGLLDRRANIRNALAPFGID